MNSKWAYRNRLTTSLHVSEGCHRQTGGDGGALASTNVAIVTVTSETNPYTTPDGLRREDQRQIRTFVVVLRDER